MPAAESWAELIHYFKLNIDIELNFVCSWKFDDVLLRI